MIYKEYFIEIARTDSLIRKDRLGNDMICSGFVIDIYPADTLERKLYEISCAVDYELLNNDILEAEQFAMDFLELERKKRLGVG